MFVVIEGIDGSGKTTIAGDVSQKLTEMGIKNIYTREPGGTYLAEKIRNLIQEAYDEREESLFARTELFLFLAARAQHIDNLIIPALNEGMWVICDRFSPSTFVYQGIKLARSSGIKVTSENMQIIYPGIKNLCDYAEGELFFYPKAKFLIDVNENVAAERILRRDGEQADIMFLRLARNIYKDVFKSEEWGMTINGNLSRDKIVDIIIEESHRSMLRNCGLEE